MNLFSRLFWFLVYGTLISGTVYFVVTLWQQFLVHPTVTTLASSTYPVSEIPFPGISICNINKLSRRRVFKLAHKIANLTKRDPEKMMEYLRFVGQLYDFDFEAITVSRLLDFQNILDTLNMSVIDLTRNLATPCEELLEVCSWRRVEVNCSSIFLLRLTHHGFCCVFNYVKLTNDLLNGKIADEPIQTDSGVENGLFVSVFNNHSDYYYTTLSSPGVMVHVFVPTDYPDKSSGSITEIFTQPNSENFVEIIPTTFFSVNDVADYPVEKRGCLFDHERKTIFQGEYSQSDCYVDCRITSILAICQCIPFLIPFSNRTNVCTLADIPCLNKYRDKWISYYPEDDLDLYLAKEMQDSLRCEKCYSSCKKTVYEAFSNSFPIFNTTGKVNNMTHVYVYYLNRFSNLYKQDVVYYWFEILSNFGGIFGIFVGWSFISVTYFIFFYLQKTATKLTKL